MDKYNYVDCPDCRLDACIHLARISTKLNSEKKKVFKYHILIDKGKIGYPIYDGSLKFYGKYFSSINIETDKIVRHDFSESEDSTVHGDHK